MKIIMWVTAVLFLGFWALMESPVVAAFLALIVFGILTGIALLFRNAGART